MLVSEVSLSEALLGRSQWCLAQLHPVVSHGDEGCRIPSASAGWDLGAHRVPVTPRGFPSSQVRWGGEQGAAGSWGSPIFGGEQSAGAPTGPPPFQGAGNWGLLTSLSHGQVCPGDGHSLSSAGLTPPFLLLGTHHAGGCCQQGGDNRHSVFPVTKGAAGVTTKAGEHEQGSPSALMPVWAQAGVAHVCALSPC